MNKEEMLKAWEDYVESREAMLEYTSAAPEKLTFEGFVSCLSNKYPEE